MSRTGKIGENASSEANCHETMGFVEGQESIRVTANGGAFSGLDNGAAQFRLNRLQPHDLDLVGQPPSPVTSADSRGRRYCQDLESTRSWGDTLKTPHPFVRFALFVV